MKNLSHSNGRDEIFGKGGMEKVRTHLVALQSIKVEIGITFLTSCGCLQLLEGMTLSGSGDLDLGSVGSQNGSRGEGFTSGRFDPCGCHVRQGCTRGSQLLQLVPVAQLNRHVQAELRSREGREMLMRRMNDRGREKDRRDRQHNCPKLVDYNFFNHRQSSR